MLRILKEVSGTFTCPLFVEILGTIVCPRRGEYQTNFTHESWWKHSPSVNETYEIYLQQTLHPSYLAALGYNVRFEKMTSGKSSKMAGSDVISASRNTHLSTAREELNRNGAGTMSSVAADSPSTNHDKNMHHTSLKLGFPRQLPSYFANFAMDLR